MGDMFHETPLVLWLFSRIIENLTRPYINLLFICWDILTSFILYKAAKLYLAELVSRTFGINFKAVFIFIFRTKWQFQFLRQEKDKTAYAEDVDDALLENEDVDLAPLYVLSAYLFNPYCILNCIGKTTTVLSNLFLSIVFYTMLKGEYSVTHKSSRGVQEDWGASAETCLVPSFHVGGRILPPLTPNKWTLSEGEISKIALSEMNYLTYLMCKKPSCDPSQKGSKWHNWVTFFWLIENYHSFFVSEVWQGYNGVRDW